MNNWQPTLAEVLRRYRNARRRARYWSGNPSYSAGVTRCTRSSRQRSKCIPNHVALAIEFRCHEVGAANNQSLHAHSLLSLTLSHRSDSDRTEKNFASFSSAIPENLGTS